MARAQAASKLTPSLCCRVSPRYGRKRQGPARAAFAGREGADHRSQRRRTASLPDAAAVGRLPSRDGNGRRLQRRAGERQLQQRRCGRDLRGERPRWSRGSRPVLARPRAIPLAGGVHDSARAPRDDRKGAFGLPARRLSRRLPAGVALLADAEARARPERADARSARVLHARGGCGPTLAFCQGRQVRVARVVHRDARDPGVPEAAVPGAVCDRGSADSRLLARVVRPAPGPAAPYPDAGRSPLGLAGCRDWLR